MSRLELSSCSVRLSDRPVLHNVDFHVAGGELVGVLGPNGVGKSTLIKVLAGLLPAPGVRLDDRKLETVPPAERARLLAYMPQSAASAWPMPCREVVTLGRMPHRRSPAQDRRIVEEAMDEADIAHLASRPLTALSGGERARVLLARALAVRAPVLLADEPVAHLDPAHQLQVLGLLRARADKGDAVVVVMHDLSLASRHCDRVTVLDGGRVAASGIPDEVLDDALLASVFGIRAARGECGGRPFLLPWERISP